MKKLVSLILAITIAISMVACSSNSDVEKTENEGTNTEKKASKGDGAELALVTDVGTINDKSFNQGSWEGLVKYAEENNIEHKYYQPADKSADAIASTIELAIKGGAKTVVCPGFLFELPVYNMQKKYPDINFIIIDGKPNNGEQGENADALVTDNTSSIFFAEEQAGFLAGYAAVLDGYRNLGFMGGIKLPAVVRYGYGFVQGTDYAAKELGLSKGDININYTYVGNFDASPEHTVKASSWYSEGTEIIFACGGGVGNSVMKAAETSGAKVIGVDVDQSVESETVITSAMKNLQGSVYQAITSIYDGSFKGGESIVLDATTNSVLLPMDTSRFENFSTEQYETIYSSIANGEVKILKDTDAQEVTEIPLEITVVAEK